MTSGRSPAFGLLTGSAQLGDNRTFAACGAIGIGDAAQKNSPKIFPKPQNEKNGGIRGWGREVIIRFQKGGGGGLRARSRAALRATPGGGRYRLLSSKLVRDALHRASPDPE
jgi:hypothetical protein